MTEVDDQKAEAAAHQVERMLGLKKGDLKEPPGLVRMNTQVIPRVRVVAMALAFVAVVLHNEVVFGFVDWPVIFPYGFFLAAWALGSWWLLVRYFAVSPIHLGDVFVWVEVPILGSLVWASGGGESLIWPVFFLRIADQMWISRTRAMWATLGGMIAMAIAFQLGALSGYALDWGIEGFKIFAIGALGLVLGAIAGAPWEVRERTMRARDLILELEARSEALEIEHEDAARANRAKNEFLRRVDTELRAPMRTVLGMVDALAEGDLDDEGQGQLSRLRHNAQHLNALLNDVIDLSQIEEGVITVAREAVDVGAIVQQTVSQLSPRLDGTSVMLQMVVPKGVGTIEADESRLRQILINLVGNAIKFTAEGHIDVQLEADPQGVPIALHVRDTGPGIDPEIVEGLFDPFERLGHHEIPAGTGFGISVSSALAVLMGFHLTIKTRPGYGSTFSVHFAPPAPSPEVPTRTADST